MPAPPELDAFLDKFETLFQGWLRGAIDPNPVNEEIERTYCQLKKHSPQRCRHGRTLLTCPECYVNGFTERGDAI
jgi:hypothetical protein